MEKQAKNPQNTDAKNGANVPATKRQEAKAPGQAESKEMEALRKQVEELQKVLQGQPKSFEERIKFFEEKQAHIKKLQKLDAYRNSTLESMEEIKAVEEEDNFFTDNFTLYILQKRGYGSEKELLKVQNPALIREVMEFSLNKLDNKREELKTLINA